MFALEIVSLYFLLSWFRHYKTIILTSGYKKYVTRLPMFKYLKWCRGHPKDVVNRPRRICLLMTKLLFVELLMTSEELRFPTQRSFAILSYQPCPLYIWPHAAATENITWCKFQSLSKRRLLWFFLLAASTESRTHPASVHCCCCCCCWDCMQI